MQRQQQEEEEGEEGGPARSLTQWDGLPPSAPTKTKTAKSVLSMNDGRTDGRIDHNFRRRESIRGSADSAAWQGGRRQKGGGAGRQKKAIAREEGRKIEKMRRGGVGVGGGGGGRG